MAFWTYILRCADDSHYVGHTDALEQRLGQHLESAVSGYVRSRKPFSLIWQGSFPTREEALAAELRVKGWSRAKKEAMMRGDWAEVSRLSKSRTRATPQGSQDRPSTSSGRTEKKT